MWPFHIEACEAHVLSRLLKLPAQLPGKYTLTRPAHQSVVMPPAKHFLTCGLPTNHQIAWIVAAGKEFGATQALVCTSNGSLMRLVSADPWDGLSLRSASPHPSASARLLSTQPHTLESRQQPALLAGMRTPDACMA